MTIKRTINGAEVEIELTENELFNAYCEQQYKWDIDSCRDNLHSGIYNGENWYKNLDKETENNIIEDAAYHLRRNIDKYDMNYDYAMDDAFVVAIANQIKEE